MNRRQFLLTSTAATATTELSGAASLLPGDAGSAAGHAGVAVLLVDTDRATAPVDQRIYGHFLEHINHSVEDGLFAEQIRGAGFEGDDFKTYWEPLTKGGKVELAFLDFQNGKKSVRLSAGADAAAIRQGRIFVQAGSKYDGSLWALREQGSPDLTLRIQSSSGATLASVPLAVNGSGWQELPFSFTSPVTDTQASIEIGVRNGAILVDFISMMRSDVRRNGMLRPDLFGALRNLRPSFIRWPGGSFASTYRWEEGIGPYAARGYHPNTFWGGYSDYFGFGTHEFLELCRKLNSEPLIVLAAPGTKPDQVEYAMNWV